MGVKNVKKQKRFDEIASLNRSIIIGKYMQHFRYLILLLALSCGLPVLKAQSVVDMSFVQNPVFGVSTESVFLNFVAPGMTLGADLVITGGSGTYSYEWQKDNTVLGKESTLYISTPGIYTLKINDTCDCELTVTFNVGNGGVGELGTGGFRAYPNPVCDMLKIDAADGKKIVQVSLVSMSGKVVALYPDVYESSLLIDATGFSDGEYLLNCVYEDKSVVTGKIIVSKK